MCFVNYSDCVYIISLQTPLHSVFHVDNNDVFIFLFLFIIKNYFIINLNEAWNN